MSLQDVGSGSGVVPKDGITEAVALDWRSFTISAPSSCATSITSFCASRILCSICISVVKESHGMWSGLSTYSNGSSVLVFPALSSSDPTYGGHKEVYGRIPMGASALMGFLSVKRRPCWCVVCCGGAALWMSAHEPSPSHPRPHPRR